MPLKHNTETFFVALLIVVLVVTGFTLATLPALPTGLLPWVAIFVVTILYPALLMPFFRAERADHEFRSLHWFPVIMTIVWLVFATLAWFFPIASIALRAYTWAWSLPMVAFATLGLLVFCAKVLRQWLKRTVLILGVFIPFVALSVWSLSGAHFEQIASSLIWSPFLSGAQVAQVPTNTESSQQSSLISSLSSVNTDEQSWQKFLASYSSQSSEPSSTVSVQASSVLSEEEYNESILGFLGFGQNVVSFSSLPLQVSESSVSTVSSTSSAPVLIGQTSSTPTHLPKSGFGIGALLITLGALYFATVHRRQLRY